MLYSRRYPKKPAKIQKAPYVPSKDEEKALAESEKLKKLLDMKAAIEAGKLDVSTLKQGEKSALKKLGLEIE